MMTETKKILEQKIKMLLIKLVKLQKLQIWEDCVLPIITLVIRMTGKKIIWLLEEIKVYVPISMIGLMGMDLELNLLENINDK